jgi:PDZ domain
MSSRQSSSEVAGCLFALLAVSVILLSFPVPGRASPDDRGTLGIVFRQLFDEAKPNHRGPLAVMHVMEDLPAAKAGIHCSDFVVAVNGVPVPGREFSDILKKDLRGPVGGTVRLTIARFDGSQSEITLVRAPYPPHVNPASDPFAYSVPGTWGADPRYRFPLPWSPALAYRGFEDLFYAPNFDQTDSPEYHSYLFFCRWKARPRSALVSYNPTCWCTFAAWQRSAAETTDSRPTFQEYQRHTKKMRRHRENSGARPREPLAERYPSGTPTPKSSL